MVTRRELLSGQAELQLKGELLGDITARHGESVTSIKCSDGALWVIDYDFQSPYQALAGRQVIASGYPYKPGGSHVIESKGHPVAGHFAVSMLKLAEVAADAWLTEVGPEQFLSGCFAENSNDTGEFPLSFVTKTGDTFLIVNNPAGAKIGARVKVSCYPVRVSTRVAILQQQHLWVICPSSCADLWELRDRSNSGLPRNVYVDACGRVRYRRGLGELGDTGR